MLAAVVVVVVALDCTPCILAALGIGFVEPEDIVDLVRFAIYTSAADFQRQCQPPPCQVEPEVELRVVA